MRSRLALLVLVLLGAASCAHYPLNAPLERFEPAGGYRFEAIDRGSNTDSLFVCLTFSGGGTRAAALAYGVLEKLRDTPIRWKGETKRLLDEVDCLATVSGGSFTAAYYALEGDALFEDFRPRFLERDVQGELFAQLLNPWNWVRLASPYFSRIDLAAELYDATLFDRGTFADLSARTGPFVMMNATNLESGERFEFTQDQLDFLGSDLSSVPLARAVAASSAFPALLSPITLRNHPQPAGYEVPADVTLGLEDFDTNRRRNRWARAQAAFLGEGKRARPYVHLMDGGLADNIGLRAVDQAYRRSSGFIRQRLNQGDIEKLLIVVVNAGTDKPGDLARREQPPGLATVAYKTATIAMDNYSFDTVELTRELVEARVRAQASVAQCQQLLDRSCPDAPRLPTFARQVEPLVVEVTFQAIRDDARRAYFVSLPTSFALAREQVDALVSIGPELLQASEPFRAFIDALE